jgi:hypothetical protein
MFLFTWILCRFRKGDVRKLENIYAHYEAGMRMGAFRCTLRAKKEMDSDIATQALQCVQALDYLIAGNAVDIPRSKESAIKLRDSIQKLISGDPGVGQQKYGEFLNPYFTGPIRTDLDTFQIALSEELKLLPLFSVEEKGNLSTGRLVESASTGYAPRALSLLNDFMKQEIDEAGRCLAFGRPTACGFHILRAVEIGLKGYVLAATGALPKLNNRNWGEYIIQMSNAGASPSLIDFLKILKAKRNPLMHPMDNLEQEDAIGIFCICQNAIETLIAEIRSNGLEAKFTSALAALPTT